MQQTEVFIGQIELFPYNFIPSGWTPCKGQIFNVSSNQALFSLLGSIYGGDGRNTFGIPNLQGAEPLPNMKYCMAIEGIYPTRD